MAQMGKSGGRAHSQNLSLGREHITPLAPDLHMTIEAEVFVLSAHTLTKL